MANQETNGEKYVCKLPPDLVKKAEVELNEKAEWRDRDIQALREMVLKNAGYMFSTESNFNRILKNYFQAI